MVSMDDRRDYVLSCRADEVVVIELWLGKFPLELASLFTVLDACTTPESILAVLFDIRSCVCLIKDQRGVFSIHLAFF